MSKEEDVAAGARMTRSASRRLSSDFADTPEAPGIAKRSTKTPVLKAIIEKGLRESNVSSSEDGSSVSGRLTRSTGKGPLDDVESSPHTMRMTRARRSSLLTEDNLASYSPARRTRAQSVASDDVQSNVLPARGRRTPIKEATGTPNKESSGATLDMQSLTARRMAVCLRKVDMNSPQPIPENVEQEEKAEKSYSTPRNASKIKKIVDTDVVVDEPKPASEIKSEVAVLLATSSNLVGTETEVLTESCVNVWQQKPSDTMVEPEAMDVDQTIVVSSDSEDETLSAFQSKLREKVTGITTHLESPLGSVTPKRTDQLKEKESRDGTKKTATPIIIASSKVSPDVLLDSSMSSRTPLVIAQEKKTISSKVAENLTKPDSVKPPAEDANKSRADVDVVKSSSVLPNYAKSMTLKPIEKATPPKSATSRREEADMSSVEFVRSVLSELASPNREKVKTPKPTEKATTPKSATPRREEVNVSNAEVGRSVLSELASPNREKVKTPKSTEKATTPKSATPRREEVNVSNAEVGRSILSEFASPNREKVKTPKPIENATTPKSATSRREEVNVSSAEVGRSVLSELASPNREKVMTPKAIMKAVTPKFATPHREKAKEPTTKTTTPLQLDANLLRAEPDVGLRTPSKLAVTSKPVQKATTPQPIEKTATPKPATPSREDGNVSLAKIDAGKKTTFKAVSPAREKALSPTQVLSTKSHSSGTNGTSPATATNATRGIEIIVAVTPQNESDSVTSGEDMEANIISMSGIMPLGALASDQLIMKPPAPFAKKFNKLASPKPETPVSDRKKHVDTPFPIVKQISLDKSDVKEHDASTLSQKSLNFSKTWGETVHGTPEQAIDTLGLVKVEEKEVMAACSKSPDQDQLDSYEDDLFYVEEGEEEEQAEGNSFIDDEAEEGDDDSMDEEERRYIAENTLEEVGIELGSDDTESEGRASVEDEEVDSFIVDDSDDVESSNEIDVGRKKKYSKIIMASDSSDEDKAVEVTSESERNDANDLPLVNRLLKANKRQSMRDARTPQKGISSLNKSLSAINQTPTTIVPFIADNGMLTIEKSVAGNECDTEFEDLSIRKRLEKNKLRKSVMIPQTDKPDIRGLNKSLSALDSNGETPVKPFVAEDSASSEIPSPTSLSNGQAEEEPNVCGAFNVSQMSRELLNDSLNAVGKSNISFAEENNGIELIAEGASNVSLQKSRRTSGGFVEESIETVPTDAKINESLAGSAKKVRKSLGMNISITTAGVFDEEDLAERPIEIANLSRRSRDNSFVETSNNLDDAAKLGSNDSNPNDKSSSTTDELAETNKPKSTVVPTDWRTIFDRVNQESKKAEEERQALREESRKAAPEDKNLKHLEKKQVKKQQLAEQKRRKEEFEAVHMAQQKLKKETSAATKSGALSKLAELVRGAPANDKSSSEAPAKKRTHQEVSSDDRKVLTATRKNATKENSVPMEQKPKRLAMMRSHEKYGFVETPMTPPRKVKFGFLEETRMATPRANIVVALSKKRKSSNYMQPSNVPPKPRWIELDISPPNSKRTKIEEASGFQIHRLNMNKDKRKHNKNSIPSHLANFRKEYTNGPNIHRISSLDLGLQRAGKTALEKFEKQMQS